MAINFQNLPVSANKLPEPGVYMLYIADAKMRTSTAGNNYLELKMEYSKGDGKKLGTLFDRIMDVESDIPRYKLRQFICALNLPITGEFNLSDLTKIVIGKKLLADIAVEKSSDPRYSDKAVVDSFHGEIYYSIDRAPELLNISASADTDIVNASDADDAGDGDEDF